MVEDIKRPNFERLGEKGELLARLWDKIDSSTRTSSSKGTRQGKEMIEDITRPNFEKAGEKGVLLARLWEIAEEDEREDAEWDPYEPPTKNACQKLRGMIEKARERRVEAQGIFEQLREIHKLNEAQRASRRAARAEHQVPDRPSQQLYLEDQGRQNHEGREGSQRG